jgi:hypothetical protein
VWEANPARRRGSQNALRRPGQGHGRRFDENRATLQGIVDGTIHGTIVQNP